MKALLALACLAGCTSAQIGTIQLGLATAPSSTLLDDVTRLRVTLTHPMQVVESTRGPNGFTIVLDVEATGEAGSIIVEGFAADNTLVAVGQSPEFGIAAINARVNVYMSPPFGVERAPVALPPRALVAGDRLTYGVILAGGRDLATGAPSDAIAIYNAYDHSLAAGKPMPAARVDITVATGAAGVVTLFGGLDAADNPTGTYWQFDSDFAPDGRYAEVADLPGFARAGAVALGVTADNHVITGTPAIEIAGANVTPRPDVSGLAASAATFISSTGIHTGLSIEAVTGRLVRFHDNTFELLTTARLGGAVAARPDGSFIVVGGGTPDEANDIVVVDPAGGISTVADVLSTAHTDSHVATTRRHVVVTGDPVEILDLNTLQPIATRPALDGLPFALPNDQVLIVDRSNGGLFLFTPPPGV